MATNANPVSESAPVVSGTLADSRPFAAGKVASGLPLIQIDILTQLAARATDANGYRGLGVAGYDVDAIDDAIEALHRAGLLNAFFVNRAARPRYHPSSLTRDGRRLYNQYRPSSGA